MDKVRQVRVLHIMSGFGGGISSLIWNITRSVDPNIAMFDVLSFTDYPEQFKADVKKLGGNTYVMPRPRKSGYKKFKQYVLELMQKGNYDLVHCHISGVRALLFKKYATKCNINIFIVHAHTASDDNDDNIFNAVIRKINQKASLASADKLASCSLLASNFVFGKETIQKKKVMHIPNGVVLENFMTELTEQQIQEYRTEFSIDKDAMVIGHIGRFNPQKNHFFMIDLINRMKDKGINFIWLFIGTGELEELCKTKATELQLDDRVRFLGRRSDVNRILQFIDVMALPSNYEGLPTVSIEAQVAGVPSVLSTAITRECDMGLNLVKFVSLNDSMDTWSDAIVEMSSIETPPSANIKNKIINNKFTSSAAAKLYEDFITSKIDCFYFSKAVLKRKVNK